MLRYIVCFVIVTGLAMAQNTKMTGSSGKAPHDPLATANKPLTPKSAMPAPRKSTAAAPVSNGTRQRANELTRLEKGSGSTAHPKNVAGTKNTTKPKSPDESSSSPPIHARYEKPKGGMTANTPGANAKNSGVPRVNKPN